VSREHAKRPWVGGICRRCLSDLRVKESAPGVSDGELYCSNTNCLHFDEPYWPSPDLNTGDLVAHPDYAALAEAIGPVAYS